MAGPEDEIQKACVKMLHLFEAQGRLRFFSVPNEGKRGFKAAQRLKNLGRRAGVPDLVILPTNGAACFIEMKAPKGALRDGVSKRISTRKLNMIFSIFSTCHSCTQNR